MSNTSPRYVTESSSSTASTTSNSNSDEDSDEDSQGNCQVRHNHHTNNRHPQEHLYTESLGRMLPVPQSVLHVDNNFVRSYNIVIHSRNRNVLQESLFSFAVSFGAISNVCVPEEDVCAGQSGAATCTDDVSSASASASASVSASASDETDLLCPVLSPVSRCVIERTFNNVQQVSVSNVLVPNAAFLQSVANTTTSPPTSIPVDPPHELHIEMRPNGSRHLYSTDAVVNKCSFICVPTETTGDTHRQYKTLNGGYAYDTPVNYLNHIDFRVYTLHDRLVYSPSDSNRKATHSPDVFHITNIQYKRTSNQFHIQLAEADLSRLQIGDIVSLVNLTFDNTAFGGGDLPVENENDAVLRTLLCTLHNQSYSVVYADGTGTTPVVYLNLDTLQLPGASFPAADAEIGCNVTASILLNESMQFTMVMQLDCLEKRLKQTFG